MADPVIVSRRRADALVRFDQEGAKLAARLNIAPPSRVPMEINRDPELKKVVELENVVAFLAAVNEAFDKKKPPKVEEPSPVVAAKVVEPPKAQAAAPAAASAAVVAQTAVKPAGK